MKAINAWWEQVPGERFWLGITGGDGREPVLAVPCTHGRHGIYRGDPLITHVRDGDMVFHYDEVQRAIVAWSTSRGRVQRRQIGWSGQGDDPGAVSGAGRMLPSWTVRLESPVPLDHLVALEQIAGTQWELFPALRALEDRVGDPIHYPFLLGSPSETQLLDGYVFKLPGMFVERFPAMRSVALRQPWAARAGAYANGLRAGRDRPAILAVPQPVAEAPGEVAALVMR